MNKQDLMKLQTCVLRVNIHCDGCKQKVKKLLQKIEGVYSIKIDAETGKVTVTGNVDPTTLVKKLLKSGKHAEIWSVQKGSSNFQGNLQNQFKNMVQIENAKVGQNNNKAHNNGGKEQHQQKMGNSYKGPMGMPMAAPPKDKKSVKFNMRDEDFDVSDDEFDDDEFDDDEYDDEFDDDDVSGDDDHDFHHGNHAPNKMMGIPMMGKGHGAHGPNGMANVHAINDNKKGGVGSNKKGGVIDIPIVLKGKSEPKKGNNGGKKGSGGEKSIGKGGGEGKNNGTEQKKGGKSKKEGKTSGGLLGFGKKSGGLFGFGKKSCKGKDIDNCKKGKAKGTTTNNGGKHECGPKKGGGKKDGPHEFSPLENGFHEIDVLKKPIKGGGGGGRGDGGRKMGLAGPMGVVNGLPNQFGPMGQGNGFPGQMGQGNAFPGQIGQPNGLMGHRGSNLGPMGNYAMGHMGNIPVQQGLPAQAMMNGGYYQGVGQGNPYNQQYMAMMMNQQRAGNGNDMYQQMMFARPYQPMNYGAVPTISPARDNYVHFFSDENANSCSIM